MEISRASQQGLAALPDVQARRANLERLVTKPLKIIRPFIEKFGTPLKYGAVGGALVWIAEGSLNPAILIAVGLGVLVGYTKQVGDRNHPSPHG